ncbi:hypothetical protein DYE50_11505 [Treponema ruminis]|uniref:Lipoprotein n=1 Tax=Treponema ruminis TaxID=744515 RepID=A0A7W8G8R1_9SPIR|nr:hypothetical protein [Treponema ruminis]MBB5225896.1 hypothetical protein [Treponema ruminis]QSI03191.1 hypothetical protein DYE50_11505 [Treponema ruminis]
MKKIIRNLAAVFAAVALVSAFASCKSNDDDDDKNNNNNKGSTVVKTIDLVKNEYATNQTQVKIETGFDSLKAGDKVKVVMKGTADKALGKAEIIICDTTAEANYWKNLADPYACVIGTEFDITTEFTVATAPVGTGAASMTLAINGLAGDTAVKLSCTSFSVTKTAAAEAPAPAAGSTVVKTIDLVKNEYATNQTQVKIETGFDSLKVGDKVKVVMKGTADKALGSAELVLCDTTEAANWWKNLADPYACEIGTEFDITTEFTVTTAPVGTGAASMTLAINGLAGDTTVKLSCTAFSVTK